MGNSEGGEVQLRVTSGFGKEILFERTVEARPGETVLAILDTYLDVEFAYGGRFINGISGIRSGYTGAKSGAEKNDWFFYSNGILSGAGAADHYPQQGDVIWWDYHSWNEAFFVPAVVGAFPQPFLNGYRGNNPGTLIMHGKTGEVSEILAEKMALFLREHGVNEVKTQPYHEEQASNRSSITMVIATWSELKNSSYWQGMEKHRQKSGWFVEFDGKNIIPLNETGERPEDITTATGAIIATGSGMGDEYPLWLITASDDGALEELVRIVISSPGTLMGKMGVVLVEGEIIELPAY